MVLGYLVFVNLLSGLLFWKDKRAAKNGSWRVPEAQLHLMELLGGVFSNWLLMYAIRHKNKKFSYYAITYLLLIAWIAVLVYFPKNSTINGLL